MCGYWCFWWSPGSSGCLRIRWPSFLLCVYFVCMYVYMCVCRYIKVSLWFTKCISLKTSGEIQLHPFLIATPDGRGWSALSPTVLPSRGEECDGAEGWGGPRASLDIAVLDPVRPPFFVQAMTYYTLVRQIAAGLPPWLRGFEPRPVHVGFVMHRVA